MKDLLVCYVGLSIANFAWQYFGGTHDYSVATERSYFQAIALLAGWLALGMPK